MNRHTDKTISNGSVKKEELFSFIWRFIDSPAGPFHSRQEVGGEEDMEIPEQLREYKVN